MGNCIFCGRRDNDLLEYCSEEYEDLDSAEFVLKFEAIEKKNRFGTAPPSSITTTELVTNC